MFNTKYTKIKTTLYSVSVASSTFYAILCLCSSTGSINNKIIKFVSKSSWLLQNQNGDKDFRFPNKYKIPVIGFIFLVLVLFAQPNETQMLLKAILLFI